MASPSKEDNILKLILENSPFREWRFKEMVREAKVTKNVANKWLKKYTKQKLLNSIKKRGRFPCLTVGSNNQVYYSLKRLYALEQIYKSGLIQGLMTIKGAKTIIIFGSMITGFWYRDSDVDLFILGNADGFDKTIYESKLKRNIELHIFENKKELQEVKTGLIKNVINGYLVKGKIQDITIAG